MADDFLEGDEDPGIQTEAGPQKKVGFLPAAVIQILKWVAIGLGLILLMVVVSVIVINATGANSPSQDRIVRSDEYEATVPEYDWYQDIPELRGITRDEVRHTYVMQIALGYSKDDQAVSVGIGNQLVPIINMLNLWFRSQEADYLLDRDNYEEIRQTLIVEINKLLSNPIKDVAFTNFQVLPM